MTERTPYCHKVRYGITGAPILTDDEMDGSHAPGVGIAAALIELVYSAPRDGKPASVSASVTGAWTRFGRRVLDASGDQVTTHLKNGPDGWPEWLAAEARLHAPADPAAPSATADQTERRDRYAAAIAKRDGHEWPTEFEDDERDYRRRADAAMTVADAEQAAPPSVPASDLRTLIRGVIRDCPALYPDDIADRVWAALQSAYRRLLARLEADRARHLQGAKRAAGERQDELLLVSSTFASAFRHAAAMAVHAFEGPDAAQAYAERTGGEEPVVPADVDLRERVREVADRLAAHAKGFQDVLDESDRGPWGRTVGADIDELRALLAALPEPRPPFDAQAGLQRLTDDLQCGETAGGRATLVEGPQTVTHNANEPTAPTDRAAVALAEVRRLCEMTIEGSVRVDAIHQARDTLAVIDRRMADEARQDPACGDSQHRHTGPCSVYASPARGGADEAPQPSFERSDVGTEFVQQIDNLDEQALAKVEADIAQSGVDTPGCDCGHDGMGVRWHDTACEWRSTPRCTCADAGPEFAPAGHYADCPQAVEARQADTVGEDR